MGGKRLAGPQGSHTGMRLQLSTLRDCCIAVACTEAGPANLLLTHPGMLFKLQACSHGATAPAPGLQSLSESHKGLQSSRGEAQACCAASWALGTGALGFYQSVNHTFPAIWLGVSKESIIFVLQASLV